MAKYKIFCFWFSNQLSFPVEAHKKLIPVDQPCLLVAKKLENAIFFYPNCCFNFNDSVGPCLTLIRDYSSPDTWTSEAVTSYKSILIMLWTLGRDRLEIRMSDSTSDSPKPND